jgi:predicted GNAT family acetyltransferase
MEEVKLKIDEGAHGAFYIEDDNEQIAEMIVQVSGRHMIILHTEVSPEEERKGLAKKLFDAMTDHARQNNLKVKAMCSFAQAQLKRNPNEYYDLLD